MDTLCHHTTTGATTKNYSENRLTISLVWPENEKEPLRTALKHSWWFTNGQSNTQVTASVSNDESLESFTHGCYKFDDADEDDLCINVFEEEDNLMNN